MPLVIPLAQVSPWPSIPSPHKRTLSFTSSLPKALLNCNGNGNNTLPIFLTSSSVMVRGNLNWLGFGFSAALLFKPLRAFPSSQCSSQRAPFLSSQASTRSFSHTPQFLEKVFICLLPLGDVRFITDVGLMPHPWSLARGTFPVYSLSSLFQRTPLTRFILSISTLSSLEISQIITSAITRYMNAQKVSWPMTVAVTSVSFIHVFNA